LLVDILHLIDRLEEMASEARRLPVGGGLVISRQRLLDIIDRMRVAVPREVYDARDVLERREQVLQSAQEEAAHLVEESKAEVEKRLAQTEVVRAAEDRAREVLAEAQTRAQDLLRSSEQQARGRLDDAQQSSRSQMREADVYALQTLKRLEQELDGFMTTVRKGINALEHRAAERPG
jgi:crotonobetainyl-CoA:carnitine CoA-transferase CaiB-like acyl-CoA transferase